jgi:hypothetical protein
VVVKLQHLHFVFYFFQCSVTLSSKMQFCVVYPEAEINTQHHTTFQKAEFCLHFFTLHGTHAAVNLSSGWLVEVAGLQHGVVDGWGTAPPSCIRSLTKTSLKSQTNFEPQVRRIQLFRAEKSSRQKNNFSSISMCTCKWSSCSICSHFCLRTSCVCYSLI